MRDLHAANNRDRETAATRSRSRSTTAHGYAERFNPPEDEPLPEPARITIPKLSSRNLSPHGNPSPARPAYSRQSTLDSPSRSQRDDSPARNRLSRVPTEPTQVLAGRGNLRPTQRNTFADDYDEDYGSANGHQPYRRDRSPPSPAPSSQGSVISRAASWSNHDLPVMGKKAPPPPPPSRAKKPPPPPPPMKRSALSSSEVSHY